VNDERARSIVEDYWRALERNDLRGATAYLAEGFIEDWPQSGERIHGPENWLKMAENHPTFPTVKLLRVTGGGDFWAAECDFVYPGSEDIWRVCALHRLEDERIAHITEYFGAPFEAAEWRTAWVEHL
jgi:hypothetical protein